MESPPSRKPRSAKPAKRKPRKAAVSRPAVPSSPKGSPKGSGGGGFPKCTLGQLLEDKRLSRAGCYGLIEMFQLPKGYTKQELEELVTTSLYNFYLLDRGRI